MQKITMIAVQSNTLWINPDQIQHIDPSYDGHNLVELEVYLVSGENVTLDDPEDIERLMRHLAVFRH